MISDSRNVLKINKTLIIIFSLLLFSSNCFSQSITWERSYLISNWTTGYSVKQTSDGNYIVCGLRTNYGGFVLKLNQHGDTIWVKYFPVIEMTSIVETNDGNYVSVGYNNDLYIIKLTANGQIVWNRQIQESGFSLKIHNLCKTNDGNYALVGEALTNGPTTISGYFIKIDDNGNKVWSKIYASKSNFSALNTVKQLNTNDYILIGVNNVENNDQFYFIKTNSVGDTLWTKNYGTNFTEIGYTLFQTQDKGFLAIGTILFSNLRKKLYFVKTDSVGNIQWSKIYGDTMQIYNLHSSDCAVKVNYNRTYAITGYFVSGESSIDTVKCFLLEIDSLGNKIKDTFFYNDTIEFSGSSIDLCNDSGYIIIGDLRNIPIQFDATSPQYLLGIKTNKNGEVLPIGINITPNIIPKHYCLFNPFPNPFNPITNIVYTVPQTSDIIIKVFNILGKEVKTLSTGRYLPGTYKIVFDGTGFPSGVYFYKLISGSFTDTKKMVLLK